MLRLIKTYHFGDACACFTKDANNYTFIKCLMSLPIVQHKTTYDLSKMDKHEVIDHVTKLHDTQKEKKDEEVELAATTTKGKFAFIQVEAFAKTMDNNIVHEVIIDLTNTGVMDKTPKACNAALADKVSPQEKTCIQLVHNLK